MALPPSPGVVSIDNQEPDQTVFKQPDLLFTRTPPSSPNHLRQLQQVRINAEKLGPPLFPNTSVPLSYNSSPSGPGPSATAFQPIVPQPPPLRPLPNVAPLTQPAPPLRFVPLHHNIREAVNTRFTKAVRATKRASTRLAAPINPAPPVAAPDGRADLVRSHDPVNHVCTCCGFFHDAPLLPMRLSPVEEYIFNHARNQTELNFYVNELDLHKNQRCSQQHPWYCTVFQFLWRFQYFDIARRPQSVFDGAPTDPHLPQALPMPHLSDSTSQQ